MHKLNVAILLLCLSPGIQMTAKDKLAPTKTVVQHNTPLGVDYILAEYYLPVKGHGGAFGTTLTPKPYIARRLDGSQTQFQLARV